MLDYFVKGKGCNYNLLTWHKTNPVPACGNKYLTDTEFILFFREKGVKIYGDYDSKFTYYVTPLNTKDKELYGHPTCKPIDILKNFVINSSNENDVILDPFSGSGSTLVAALRNDRQYIGFEINEEYYNNAIARLDKEKKSKKNNKNKSKLF